MNHCINILSIFIIIFSLFFFKFINIKDGKPILHKFLIFISVFLFQFIIELMLKLKNECKFLWRDIFKSSIETALVCVIGYSIFIDTQFMGNTISNLPITDCPNKPDLFYTNKISLILYLQVAIIITLMITFYRILQMIFGGNIYECVKYDQN